jgi:hypothetical protein
VGILLCGRATYSLFGEKSMILLLQKDSLPKGAILHVKGINCETSLENIRETLLKEGLDVAYVNFARGDEEAWVRLLGENSAKEVCD